MTDDLAQAVLPRQRQLAETRYRYPYIGEPRFDHTGMPRSQHCFHAPPTAIIWTADDQCEAIDRGLFVERATASQWGAIAGPLYGADNHAHIIPMAHSPYVSDKAVMDMVEREVFHRVPWAMKLLAFIIQQDSYGWAGAWEPRIQRLTTSLKWYKTVKSVQRAHRRTHSERGKLGALKRWSKTSLT